MPIAGQRERPIHGMLQLASAASIRAVVDQPAANPIEDLDHVAPPHIRSPDDVAGGSAPSPSGMRVHSAMSTLKRELREFGQGNLYRGPYATAPERHPGDLRSPRAI